MFPFQTPEEQLLHRAGLKKGRSVRPVIKKVLKTYCLVFSHHGGVILFDGALCP